MGQLGESILDSDRVRALDDYRDAVRSRRTDDAEARLQKSGKAMFCILAGGQELAQISAARQLKPGDWARGYYRAGAEVLALGTVSVREMIAQVIGDTVGLRDPSSGGRMMGRHFGTRLLNEQGNPINFMQQVNRASDVSSTGSQLPMAVGLARASRVFRDVEALHDPRFSGLSHRGGEVAHVSVGDASMAEGNVYEAIAQAVVQQLPLVISVFDNGYGISVPGTLQLPHGSASQALSGFAPRDAESPGLKIVGPVEGWNYPRIQDAYRSAFDWVRQGKGPALVHALVTQPYGHSSSGDHTRYKTPERLQWEVDNDCLTQMRGWLIRNHMATEHELDTLEEDERAYVDGEAQAAWNDYYQSIIDQGERVVQLYERVMSDVPDLADILQKELAGIRPKVEKGSSQYLSRGEMVESLRTVMRLARRANVQHLPSVATVFELHDRLVGQAKEVYSSKVYAEGEKSPLNARFVGPQYSEEPEQDTQAHLIAAGIATLMKQDPRIVSYGEDAGKLGGVTTCTLGLQGGEGSITPQVLANSPAIRRYLPPEGFGEGRSWDHAIAESTIVGTAVGLAMRGLKPIAEIQYHDYVVWGLQQMVDELSTLRHRTDGGQEAPALIRTHGHQLVGMWHSGSPMGMVLSSCPGLRVLVPRNAVQAIGMYRAVLQGGDPAFSVEPLMALYQKAPVPENLEDICVPLGQSEVLREGGHATIITYGYNCQVALQAAEMLAEDGVDVEVVDLQTLSPLDANGVALESIKKTGKVLFLDEDVPNGAMAMVQKALINDRGGLMHIDAMDVMTAPEHKPAYGKDGKYFGKPQPSDVSNAVLKLIDSLDNGTRHTF